MKTLVVYDETGYILLQRNGQPAPREPVGVPFMWVEVPEGKQVTGVDVSVTPHQAVLEDIPPTEVDVLKQRIAETDALVLSLIESMYS